MKFSFYSKLTRALSGGVITLTPNSTPRGRVLLSYLTEPFTKTDDAFFANHTNRWECREIARIFLEKGYVVDVIDWQNRSFIPKHPYRYAVDIHSNLQRWSPYLPATCTKIFHATGSHWLFQNTAEFKRLLALQQRRGVTLMPNRTVSPSYAIEHADEISILGNHTTQATYHYAGKPLSPIPLSTTHSFPFPDTKNIKTAQTRFMWFGGGGSVHKGLDLTLEAFAKLPQYHLDVCGKIDPDFADAYAHELTQLPNITLHGWVDPGSEKFATLASTCIALVHPSCSEGQSGAVILGLHAGLIPIISRESGVDVTPFGIELASSTIETITEVVESITHTSVEEVFERMRSTWEYARTHHTRDEFARTYREFIERIERKENK